MPLHGFARAFAVSLALFALAPAASAVTIDWTFVGDAGNVADSTGYGAVGDAYNIGTYEVTNAQYAEFLNAKAASDPLALYNTSMGSGFAGITRSGVSGGFTYSAISGRGEMPVNFVSFYDALRFSNWLHNGQGAGATETGAYTLLGGTATPSSGTTVTRNAGATIFLTSEDEWYKAAYHNAIGLAATDYFDYPAGFDAQTICTAPTAATNLANCDAAGSDASDPDVDNLNRQTRGGSFGNSPINLAAAVGGFTSPTLELDGRGFRVASVPEPGTGLLLMLGLLGIARPRRPSA